MRLGRHLLLLPCIFALLAVACDDRRGAPQTGQAYFVGRDVEAIPLGDGVWRHVSKNEEGIAANGLVVDTEAGLVLVDATWSDEQAEILLAWARKKLGKQWTGAIVTHDHVDRTGGIAAVARYGIPVHALAATANALTARGLEGVSASLAEAGSRAAVRGGLELFYPGPGHAPDNLVVWLPERGILFGGCLVKAAAADELGNVADADLTAWPGAVRTVAERYPAATIVVPGHGEPSGRAAFERTLALLEAFEPPPDTGQASG